MNDELYVTDELGNLIGTTDKESAAKFLPLPVEATVEPAKHAAVEYSTTSVPATLPAHSGSVLRVVEKTAEERLNEILDPIVEKAAEELGAAAAAYTFEGFKKLSVDDQIDKLLTDPTIVAMVENAVQGAVQDALDNQEADEPYTHANYLTPVAELRAEFEEFRDRVAAAFKHAGFKF